MGIVSLIVLLGVAAGLIVIVRRVLGRRGGVGGSDVLIYLLLALAVGVAAFALASLAAAAFPGDSFIGDSETQVATSLAGLVVAGPIAFILWRRQAQRRIEHPESAGWTVYLALIEAVFMTSFAVAAGGILFYLLGEGDTVPWVNAVVFAGVVVLHEAAVRRTPPMSDAGDLYRVIGSAIGLVATSIGAAGILYWLLDLIYGSLAPTASEEDPAVWLAFLIVGAPIWAYRWWRTWDRDPGTPMKAWLVITSVAGLVTVVGTVFGLVVTTLLYFFDGADPAATHFAAVPGFVGTGVVALAVWAHHRQRMGKDRSPSVQFYGYAMSAIGLSAAITGATGLTTIAFAPADFINEPTEFAISLTGVLVAGLLVWWYFWSAGQSAPRELEVASPARRLYLIGFGVVTGLTSAGALIGVLVVVFQWIISRETSDALAVQASLFIFSGLATWHLLRVNAGDRDLIESPEVVTPFDVTLVCSHPGSIATLFPKEARLRVIYRGDEAGLIDDSMAEAIVEAVGANSSMVWVDETGYRIAPARG